MLVLKGITDENRGIIESRIQGKNILINQPAGCDYYVASVFSGNTEDARCVLEEVLSGTSVEISEI